VPQSEVRNIAHLCDSQTIQAFRQIGNRDLDSFNLLPVARTGMRTVRRKIKDYFEMASAHGCFRTTHSSGQYQRRPNIRLGPRPIALTERQRLHSALRFIARALEALPDDDRRRDHRVRPDGLVVGVRHGLLRRCERGLASSITTLAKKRIFFRLHTDRFQTDEQFRHYALWHLYCRLVPWLRHPPNVARRPGPQNHSRNLASVAHNRFEIYPAPGKTSQIG
jgi:hypothetical protein